jgi:hypothetical protein
MRQNARESTINEKAMQSNVKAMKSNAKSNEKQ